MRISSTKKSSLHVCYEQRVAVAAGQGWAERRRPAFPKRAPPLELSFDNKDGLTPDFAEQPGRQIPIVDDAVDIRELVIKHGRAR